MNAFNRKIAKYQSVFTISLLQEFYYSASFFVDRARSITIIIAFFGFWSAIFQDRASLAGYSQAQMFTYIMGMNILRALVFADKAWEMIREINTGKISSYLIRPISYIGYSVSRDAANKAIQTLSSLCEVTLAVWILKISFFLPNSWWTVSATLLTIFFAVILYFLMTYAVGALAFWTAESMGPRFCFELFVEFAAGAFFPLDILPANIKQILELLPFASLLHFPLNVFLGRIQAQSLLNGLLLQCAWIIIFALLARWVWTKGLKIYGAEGG